MAVLGRLLVSSAERLDLPDLLSLDSYASGDWKYFLKGLVGDTKPYILKGFDVIDPGNAIGTQSCSIRVADSITFYPGSNSGSFFHGLQEGHAQAAPLVPELRKNAVNYVYLTFSTFNTSVDTRAFWDPDKDGGVGGEFTQDINTQSVLKVDVNVSTGSFPANTVPVAKITVGPVVITAIEDARDLMFRLGSGGINPNPFNTYAWRTLPGNSFARQEPTTQMLAGGINPFQGADKNILTLKEWMDAVMSKLRELGGTTYWYDDTSSFSIVGGFYDALATAFKSKGKWVHDTVTPGLLTWTEDIQIKLTSDPRSYIIRQGSKTLSDEQVMYLAMVRNKALNVTDENVSWINGQTYVNTIGGAVGLFANLSKGDYIKKANDTIDKWVRVEEFYDAVSLGGSTTTAAGARSVRLSSAYLGVTGAEKGRYDKGSYLPADIVVSDRNQAAIGNAGGQFHWLAIRSDTVETVGNAVTTSLSCAIDQHDGSTARVTATAHGLVDGDRITISGTTNFNGTYVVEVETANIFYITKSGGPYADESGTGRYATITTVARSTPYGFQEESANHGFKTDDTITIAGTTNYNGNFAVSIRSSTSFTIPMSSAAATETVGTARLARVIVRTEGAVAQIIQGQVIDIGGSVADNIRQYVGMSSLSQTAPIYAIPTSYNTLDGMQNWNATANENLTARVSKLSAMMADKAQDKMIRALPSAGINSINNTTNGSAQEITFTPAGASLTLVTPGSTGQCFISLPSSSPGISLLTNQAAYVTIDRNNPTTGTITVANIASVPVDENAFLVAVRLAGTEVYLWEGSIITAGSVPGPGYINTVVRQNQALKLVDGGTWSLTTTPTTVALINNSDTTGSTAGDHIVLHQPANTWIGYKFTVTGTKTITDASLYLQRVGGTGNIQAVIANDTGSGIGSTLFTSAPVALAGISNVAHTVTTFNFTGATLSAGNYVVYIPSVSGVILGTPGWSSGTNVNVPVYQTSNGGASYIPMSINDYLVINSSATSTLQLTNSTAAYIQIPGLANSVNQIAAQNINLTSGQVAYVDINRTTPGGTLAVTVAANSTLAMTTDRFIIAREDNGEVIVGNHSMRLMSGESKRLYTGISNQHLTFAGATSNADSAPAYTGPMRTVTQGSSLKAAISSVDTEVDKWFGQLKMKVDTNTQRVIIRAADNTMLDTTIIGQEMANFLLKFDGAIINFATGVITEADGTTPLGINFTPTSMASGQWQWYSVALVPNATTSDNKISSQIVVIAGPGTGVSAALAPKAVFGGLKKIGQVAVQSNGASINPISNSNIVQLGVGSGSGGGTGFIKVTAHSFAETTLPTGSVVIDGVTIQTNDLVLFTGLSSGNNKVYKASGFGATITGWASQYVFQGGISTTPENGDFVYVKSGEYYLNNMLFFDGTAFKPFLNQKLTQTLTNNTTANLFILEHALFQNIVMEYGLSRGTARRTGHVYINTNGTETSIADSFSELNSCGVTFNALVSGAYVIVVYTTDNSGSAATLTRTVRMW